MDEIRGNPPAVASSNARSMPPECDAYRDAIDKIARCEKIPADTRQALKDAFMQMSSAWDQVPVDAMADIAAACKAGADAVRQADPCR